MDHQEQIIIQKRIREGAKTFKMNNCKKQIILLLFCSFFGISSAFADDSEFEWMQSSLTALTNLFSTCIERPASPGITIQQASTRLYFSPAPDRGMWQSTGIYVEGGKSIELNWNTQYLTLPTRLYKVLYRVDPRFETPQVFIKKFDRGTGSYFSDFHNYLDRDLLMYQDRKEIDFQNRTKDFVDYFNFVGRDEIMMTSGDTANILIEDAGEFFNPSNYDPNWWTYNWWFWGMGDPTFNEFDSEYPTTSLNPDPELIYTTIPFGDNRILYMDAYDWCNGLSITCPAGPPVLYENASYPRSVYVGSPSGVNVAGAVLANGVCGDSVIGRDHPFCYFDKGRGVKISQGGTTVKDTYEKFVTHTGGRYFYYYVADADGPLRFSTDMDIAGMITNYTQFMKDWTQSSYADFRNYLSALPVQQSQSPFMHLGRYFFTVEIGNAGGNLTADDINSISFSYYIQEDGQSPPSNTTSGVQTPQNFRSNANASGYLWIRATSNNSEVSGPISVKIKSYTGSQWFSSTIYSILIEPLRDKINEVSYFIYSKLITDSTLQRIARTALTLYIIIYGLAFLMGASEITVTEIVTRVIKVAIVLMLFSDAGWDFFNTYLFNLFVEGTDYLMSNVVGETSEVGNPFRFIDPILDRYTDPTFWSLLGIQLLQIHNGLCFFAILTIYSILIFYRAVFEVIVSYVIAYIGMSVLISLAPFFIILMLFEKTKGMFDAWISNLFNFMIQPTILLIFFLLIDQLMAQQITNLVVRACWDILIPITIGLDLNHLGIPISFSFSLPFLPGIPFFVSQVEGIDSAAMLFGQGGTFLMVASSSLLFFAYCKLAAGLIDYVSLVVQMLTNVQAARQYGKLQRGGGVVGDIRSDRDKLLSPFIGAAKSTGRFAKEKLIDQKYGSRPDPSKGPNYSRIHQVESEGADKAVDSSSSTAGGGSSSQQWSKTTPTGQTGDKQPSQSRDDNKFRIGARGTDPSSSSGAGTSRSAGAEGTSSSTTWKRATPTAKSSEQSSQAQSTQNPEQGAQSTSQNTNNNRITIGTRGNAVNAAASGAKAGAEELKKQMDNSSEAKKVDPNKKYDEEIRADVERRRDLVNNRFESEQQDKEEKSGFGVLGEIDEDEEKSPYDDWSNKSPYDSYYPDGNETDNKGDNSSFYQDKSSKKDSVSGSSGFNTPKGPDKRNKAKKSTKNSTVSSTKSSINQEKLEPGTSVTDSKKGQKKKAEYQKRRDLTSKTKGKGKNKGQEDK